MRLVYIKKRERCGKAWSLQPSDETVIADGRTVLLYLYWYGTNGSRLPRTREEAIAETNAGTGSDLTNNLLALYRY